MNGTPFSQEEENYIRASHKNMGCHVIAKNLSFIFGTPRNSRAVYDKLKKMRLNAADKKTTQLLSDTSSAPDGAIPYYVPIPRGKIIIRTRRLFQVMTNTNTGVEDLSEEIDLHEDSLRALIFKGGIPAPFAGRITEYYAAMGEKIWP